VLTAQGQGFELYAIAAAVIGGTSLSGGIGTIWGTIIGVFIMSVLSTGLPSLNLEAHYQTFFTGIIVIGAVLLDMYRNRKASEVRIETPADLYLASMNEKIGAMRGEASAKAKAGDAKQAAAVKGQIRSARLEAKATFARMKAQERADLARIRAEEKAADREFAEMLRRRELSKEEETERQP
jgi:ribose transport system permease protein